MADFVTIVATGARTPLGFQAAPSAAAIRAGISAIKDHPFMIDRTGEPMPGAIDSFLDPALFGPDRFIALAETALKETCAPLALSMRPLLKLPLYLGLPEIRPGFTVKDAQMIQSRLANVEGLPLDISDLKVFTKGHAAGLLALAAANEQIQKGVIEACLVGGVESYFQPDTMEWLNENRQLAGADARSAFVPGEGAGFCLVMGTKACKRWGLPVLARVVSIGVENETKLIKTSDICLGEGMTAAVRNAVKPLSLPEERINHITCDINGERYRGEEWGFVCLRLSQYFDDPTAYLSPADRWGDMGAASGPLFVMLACQAAVRGYAKGPRVLLWTSSEGGLRTAAVLAFETAGRKKREGMNHV